MKNNRIYNKTLFFICTLLVVVSASIFFAFNKSNTIKHFISGNQVNKLDPAIAGGTLSSLTIDEIPFTFDPEELDYFLTAPDGVTSITVRGTLTNPNDYITGLGSHQLESGNNTIEISVTDSVTQEINYYALYIYVNAISTADKLSNIYIDGETISSFNPAQNNYTINIPYGKNTVIINADKYEEAQKIEGLGSFDTSSITQTKQIKVTAPDNSTTRTYNLTFIKEVSTFLKTLTIPDYILSPGFNSGLYNYNLTIPTEVSDITVNYTLEDARSNATITGNTNIPVGLSEIKITVTGTDAPTRVYTIKVEKAALFTNDYSYTGKYQTFTAPYTGLYKLEVWGASGYTSAARYGRGGYSSGYTVVTEGTKLYVYVGEHGNFATSTGTMAWNGGGENHGTSTAYSKGGGGTDIRLTPTAALTTWNDVTSLRSRIIVAGGGSADGSNATGGTPDAGGLTGISVRGRATPGGQTKGHAFGYGRGGYASQSYTAGGGGYWGGSSTSNSPMEGAGGSGYVSGFQGCVAVESSASTTPRLDSKGVRCTEGTTDQTCSLHYSGYEFLEPVLLGGYQSMPNPAGGTMTGRAGAGYARISYVGQASDDARLQSIDIPGYNLNFDPDTFEYNLTVDQDTNELEITALPIYVFTKVTGSGKYTINPTTTTLSFTSTSPYGNTEVYKVNITRNISDTTTLKDIKIDDNSIENFIPTNRIYNITVPYTTSSVAFSVIKNNTLQTVGGDTTLNLNYGLTIHTITVKAEDGVTDEAYIINITREYTSVLSNLIPERFSFTETFDKEKYEYNITVNSYVKRLELDITTYDPDATYIVNHPHSLEYGSNNTVTITVSRPPAQDTIYTIHVTRKTDIESNVYNTNSSYHLFTAPATATYRLEAWGASGLVNAIGKAGMGAYTSGTIQLDKGEKIYIYVGGSSTTVSTGGYNGGGAGAKNNNNTYGASGGGATDFRYFPGTPTTTELTWNNATGLRSRIMVAAGGGGSSGWPGTTGNAAPGGSGGTLIGKDGSFKQTGIDTITIATGGSQVLGGTAGASTLSGGPGNAGSFGIGGAASTYGSTGYGGGGGGGYYGGGGGAINDSVVGSGAGGSSFVSGCEGCMAVTSTGTIAATNIHYSGKTFWDIEMFAGNDSMPNPSGGTMIGRSGNGMAKISIIASVSDDPTLAEISIDGVPLANFDREVFDYYYTINDALKEEVIIDAVGYEEENRLFGLGEAHIAAPNDTKSITVMDSYGNIKVYNIHFTRPLDNHYKLENILINGEAIEGFNPEIPNYSLTVPFESDEILIEVDKEHYFQNVQGIGKVPLSVGNNVILIKVTAEDNSNFKEYTLTITREASTKLLSLDIPYNLSITPAFSPENYHYEVLYPNYTSGYFINAVPADATATVTIDGPRRLIYGLNTVTVTVTHPLSATTTYEIIINRKDVDDNEVYNYGYTGKYQIFTAPINGYYQMEVWGASGYTSSPSYGRGGYSKGLIKLEKDEIVYIYVGEEGNYATAYNVLAWNGGGENHRVATDVSKGGGGTDIRLIPTAVSTTWNEVVSLRSRIIVAGGGGGGGSNSGAGGGGSTRPDAGGLKGITPNANIKPGGQTTGFAFGYGRGGYSGQSYAGSGGGYWGGNSSTGSPMNATGGSGYVSGHLGAVAVESSASTTARLNSSGVRCTEAMALTDISCSYHYSDKIFEETVMYSGNEVMPNPSGGTMTGRAGAGFARITIIKSISDDASLQSLTTDAGTLSPTFDTENDTYSLSLTSEQANINITAIPNDPDASIVGDGLLRVPAGLSTHEIIVTASDGTTQMYYININRAPSSYRYLEDITINGESIEGFLPTKLNYVINYPFDGPETIEIDGIKGRYAQTVIGFGTKNISSGVEIFSVEVTPETGGSPVVYTITINKDHSNLLKTLEVEDFHFTPAFDTNTFHYNLNVPSDVQYINVFATPYDDSATVTVRGAGYLLTGSNDVQIIVTVAGMQSVTYNITVERETEIEMRVDDYKYTGKYQEYIVPATGNYLIELWGASGRTTTSNYGRGGYTKGTIYLEKDTVLYVYVGEEGQFRTPIGTMAWNGGGENHNNTLSYSKGGGGTDIRLTPTSKDTIWNEETSLRSRIMVAGGGGGSANNGHARPDAGGLVGTAPRGRVLPGSQTGGWRFGYGRGGYSCESWSGAGGGYWGGSSTTCQGSSSNMEATGGSSFISGYLGAVAVESASSTSPRLDSKGVKCANGTNDITCSYHYSGYVFKNSEMIAGNSTMPNPLGGYSDGRSGDGYARITYLKNLSSDANLYEIKTDKGEISPKFDPEQLEYFLELDSEQTEVTIEGVPNHKFASVEGDGEITVKSGTTTKTIVVTAEDGTEKTYTLNIIRLASSNAEALDITITGLNPSLCNLGNDYCILEPEFKPNQTIYVMNVPEQITNITFEVTKGHPDQEVTGDGEIKLVPGENHIVIIVTSEDGLVTQRYNYYITKDLGTNTFLKELKITNPNVPFTFNKENTEYFVTVNNEVETFDLIATPEDEYANVEISPYGPLEVGMTTIVVKVVAHNGMEKNYILNVTRNPSSNSYLNYLEVRHNGVNYPLTPNFSKTIKNYTLTVPNNVDNVDLLADADELGALASGLGNKELKVGINKFNINVTALDSSIGTYQLTITREPSNNNYIRNLDVHNAVISPAFESTIQSYTTTVSPSVTELDLAITLDDPTATYTINGNSNLKAGDNTITINVKAENGEIRKYTIVVNKIKSNNAYLSNLETDKGPLNEEFDKTINDYTINVNPDITSIKITGTLDDSRSKIEGNGTYSLAPGENEIIINVTAEDGTTNTYTLIVNRIKESNANLIDIVNSLALDLDSPFNPDELNYKIYVSNETKAITITGIRASSLSTVTGNGLYNLNIGDNNIQLVVTAQDGITTKTYNVNVIRALSDNANLKSLIVHEGALNPSFDKNTTTYDLKIAYNVNSLNIEAIPEYPNAHIDIIDNGNFNPGNNSVIIKVTSENGEVTKEYTLNVYKQEEGTYSSDLLALYTNKGTLTPTFAKDTIFYTINLPYAETSINVYATKADPLATITGTGFYSLNVGDNIIAVKVTSQDGIEKDYQIKVIRAASPDARLKSLSISGTALSPAFNSDTYTYAVSTTSSSLNITAVPIENDATYEIIGNIDLGEEEKEVIIRVTAPDNITTQDYIIKVKRELSNNNNLSSLSVIGYEIIPAFSPSTTLYNLNVSNDIHNIIVEAVASDPNATIEGIGNITLESGTNTIRIIVTSESGKTKEYVILVEKDGSDNNLLKDIVITEGSLDPDFDKLQNDYNVIVENNITSIDITGILDADTSSVMGGGTKILDVGNNEYELIVTSESGKVNTYKVNVFRKSIISSKLERLGVEGYSLTTTFNPDILEYMVVVPNEITQFNISDLIIKPYDLDASINVTGNTNFIIGLNPIKIEVTASDSSSTTIYTLNINRQLSSNTYLEYLTPSKGTLDFDKTKMQYTINLPRDTDSITFYGRAESDSSIAYGLDTLYQLEPGENTIYIKVVSAIGVERTYTIKVNRTLDNNNLLKSLNLKAGNEVISLNPAFDPNQTTYSVDAPIGQKELNIDAVAQSIYSTVTGAGKVAIISGGNTVTITVTAENGSIKKYTINVSRPKSQNNNLTGLIPSTGELKPPFSYNETNYVIDIINNAALLEFTVYTEDPNAIVTGHEQKAIPDGTSTRTIKVTAENGSVKTYTITVNKNRTDDARLNSLVVNGVNLSPKFDKDVFNYYITVPFTKTTFSSSEITATPFKAGGKVEYMGIINLDTNKLNQYIVKGVAEDGFTTLEYNIYITREKSDNALLEKLEVAGYNLNIPFFPTTYDYTVTFPTSKLSLIADEVTAIPGDPNATVTKMSVLAISPTSNVYKITVTSEDGKVTKEYRITVQKELSTNNNLRDIILSEGTLEPAFDKTQNYYDVYLVGLIDDITITGIPDDESASVSNPETIQLTGSETTHTIAVVSESGHTNYYYVTIHLNPATSTILKDIKILGLTEEYCAKDEEYCLVNPSFDENIFDYELIVPNEVDRISFEVTKDEPGQIVTGDDPKNLLVNDNYVTIRVTNGTGEYNEYRYKITRLISDNNYIRSLTVKDNVGYLSPDFDKTKTEYYVTVPYNIENIDFNVVLDNVSSDYEIIDNTNLVEGTNTITIRVTANNNSTRDYIINVNRDPEHNNYLSSLEIKVGGVSQTLTPDFNKVIKNYKIVVPNDIEQVDIIAVAEDLESTVFGDGIKTVKTGNNNLMITVTPKFGNIAIYNILVIRERSDNAYIRNITSADFLEIDKPFEKETYNYHIKVDNLVTSLNMDIYKDEENSSYVVVGNRNFKVGLNTVRIETSSESGKVTKTYILTVERGKSTIDYLQSLTTSRGAFDEPFVYDQLNYTKTVDHNIASINIIATKAASISVVEGDGVYALSYGDNPIEVKVTSETGDTRIYKIVITRLTNDNNYLSNIIINKGTLNPDFKPETTYYTVSVPYEVDKIDIFGVKEDLKASVTGNKVYDLHTGPNEFTLTVTSESNKTRDYTIKVIRDYSDNIFLSKLYVEEGKLKPDFNKNTINYTVLVPNEITSATVIALPEDPASKITITGGDYLNLGDNEVIVTVTSESNHEKKDYYINIIRQEKEQFSNYLTSLTTNRGTLTPSPFEPTHMLYELEVPHTITDISVSAIRQDPNASIIGTGLHTLLVGENIIYVTVTSKDNIERTYIIKVNRLKSSDARIKNLNVAEGSLGPVFNRDTYAYNVNVPATTNKLTLSIETLEPDSTYEIINNENLVSGNNEVFIKVTAPDGIATKTYTINVNKAKSNNNYLSSLTDNYDLIQNFTSTNQGPYHIEVERNVNDIILSGLPVDPTAQVEGLGLKDLEINENIFIIKVTSEMGNERIYTLIVNRKGDTNNLLNDLYPDSGEFTTDFNPTINDYEMVVPYETETISFNYVKATSYSSVLMDNSYNLGVGDNFIDITVLSESGIFNVYKVKVVREAMISSKLLNIWAKEGVLEPVFNKDTLEYDIEVPYEVKSLTLTIEKEDERSEVNIVNNSNFNVGFNAVEIHVTDINNQKTVYTLNVTRQVSSNNFLSNLKINPGTLNEPFVKTDLLYTATVGCDVNSIQVSGTREDSSSSVNGFGTYNLQPGENEILVTVKSSSNITRTYRIIVTKELSTNNLLSNILIKDADGNPIPLNENFDPLTKEYTINVNQETDLINVEGILQDSRAEISGNGNYQLTDAKTEIHLSVLSESSALNVYKITVNKSRSSSTNLNELVPSIGTLSPTFDNYTDDYEIILTGSVDVINFTAEAEDSTTTIEIPSNTLLDYGENNITIKVLAQDGTERQINIKVILQKPLEDIIVSKDEIVATIGEVNVIDLTFVPTEITSAEVTWTSDDEDIASVIDGVITAVGFGQTTVTVTSVDNPNIYKTITVIVHNLTIESEVYEINRKKTDDPDLNYNYVIGVTDKLKLEDFVKNFKNEDTLIKIYDKSDNLLTDYSKYTGTGMIIRLEYKGMIHDELRIIVRGDADGDGLIAVSDSTIMNNHILGRDIRTGYILLAMKINNSASFDILNPVSVVVGDATFINNYILGRESNLNNK